MVNASEFTLSFESFQCSFQRLRLYLSHFCMDHARFVRRLRLPASFLSHKDAGVLLPACPFLLLAQKKWAKEKGSTAWCFFPQQDRSTAWSDTISDNVTHAARRRNEESRKQIATVLCGIGICLRQMFWVSVSLN